MAYNPTVVIGHLNDQELKNSINSLVAHVNEGMNKIVSSTNTAVENIKNKLKELETTSKATNAQRSTALEKEAVAADKTRMSYDQMQTALEKIAKDSGVRKTPFNQQQLQEYMLLLRQLQAELIKVHQEEGAGPKSDKITKDIENLKTLIKNYKSALEHIELVNSRQASFDARKWVQDLGAVDKRYSQLVRWYSVLEREDQRLRAAQNKQHQDRIAQIEKERQAEQKAIEQYQNSILKVAFARANKIPTDQVDLMQAKLERLQSLLIVMRQRGILSPQQIAATESEIRRLEAGIRSVSETQKTTTQNAREYTEEIKRQAQEIRNSDAWKRGESNLLTNQGVVALSRTIPLEEQLLQLQEMGYKIVSSTANEQQRVAQNTQKTAEAMNNAAAGAKKVKENWNIPSFVPALESANSLSKKLKELREQYNKLNWGQRQGEKGEAIARKIREITRAQQVLNNTIARPKNMKEIIGLDESTLDNIAYKIRQLQAYKRGINIADPKNAKEIRDVDNAINRLNGDLNKYMRTTQQTMGANNALSRSWNYMKNRLAFYFTVGASTQFIKNLIDVRSQYEMNERALGILIDSAERGTQIFNELSQMALVSPYTLIELSAAAKQLTAYDVAAKDVVDTTRRLADMAAAVGIPIDRLTYALGQIKAYGYLNSRDARMFANAGIPLVKQLADYYTELEGRMVSVGEVYDKIKKKTIDYNTVMNVVSRMTDEGGKFFNFQAKMADTLKVRLANLTLAWNNMLNDIGKQSQGILTWGIGAFKTLFTHWKQFDKLIKDVAWIVGIRTGLLLLGRGLLQLGVSFGNLNKMMTANAIFGKKLAGILRTLWASTQQFAKMSWPMLAALAVFQLTDAIIHADSATKEFNKSLRETAKTAQEDLSKFLDSDINVSLRKDLGQNRDEKGAWSTITPASLNEAEAKNAWETVREQIELTTQNSDDYISRLITIENYSERLRQGFAILDEIREVDAVLKDVGDKTIQINKDFSAWWNLGALPEGLVENLKDYTKHMDDVGSRSKYTAEQISKITESVGDVQSQINSSTDDYRIFKNNLEDTVNSINALIENQNWTTDVEKISEVYSKVTKQIIQDNQLNPAEAFRLQLEMEEARAKAAKDGLMARIQDEKNALEVAENENAKRAIQNNINVLNQQYADFEKTSGRGKALWDAYTTWMKERHISEMRTMFGDMNAEEIKKINFSEGKWKDFVMRTTAQFANDHNLAINDVFNLLHNWVQNANQWSIFIPLTISSEGGKSILDTLNEADSQVEASIKNIERLKREQQRLMKQGGVTSADADVARKYLEVTKEIAAEEDALKKAREKGGYSKTEEKDALKAAKEAERERKRQHREALKQQRQEETELQKALRDQLSIIDKIRNVYKTLTSEGKTHATAVDRATKGYEKTTKAINSVLQKWGIEAFDPKKYAGISDPNEFLKMLSDELNAIIRTGRAKPTEIKELEVKVKDLEVDADKFNMTRIIKSLDSELGKIKDEYEIAIEADANPELADVFADMVGIGRDEMNSLPKNFEEVLERMQSSIDAKLGSNIFDLQDNLNKSNFEEWLESHDIKNDSALAKELNTFVETANKIRLDESKKTIDEWERLLEKYAEYEHKRTLIIQKAKHERDIAIQKNASKEVLFSIDNRESQELAKLDFEQFQKTPTWMTATSDVANLANSAINELVKSINNYKKSAKNLSPREIQKIDRALIKLRKEQKKGSPFRLITEAMEDAKDRFEEYQIAIDETIDAIDKLEKAEDDKGELDVAQTKKLDKLRKVLAQLRKEQKEVGKVSPTQIVEGINEAIQVAQQATAAFSEMANAIGGRRMTEAAQTLSNVTGILEKGGQGALTGAQIGGGYGAAIGAVVGVLQGVVTTYADIWSGNAAITKQVQETTRAITRLENAYKLLGEAMENAYGYSQIGVQNAIVANKELELSEKKRQLELEESRKGKNRDEDEIERLRGEILDLEIEIRKAVKEIASSILGISNVGDAAESLVANMITAFRNGEEYMKSYSDTFEDMINNMVMKAITGKVIGEKIQQIFDEVDKIARARADEKQIDVKDLMGEDMYDWIAFTSTHNPLYNAWPDMAGTYDEWVKALEKAISMTTGEQKEQFQAYLNKLNDLYSQAAAPTPEDVQNLREQRDAWENDVKNTFDMYMDLFGIKFGEAKKDDESSNLSALQQGIQGITEDTAGALEAYMNGVSQQVYLHSDLLTQIRDAVVGYDLDVQTASISQILLQLQSSYQVQMSIYNTITSVVSPSGRSFNVELIN